MATTPSSDGSGSVVAEDAPLASAPPRHPIGFYARQSAPPTVSKSTFTVADAVDRAGFTRFHVALLILAGAVWAADAMEMMLLSFVGPAASCEWGLSGSQEAALSTAVFGGMLVGAYGWGAMSDAFGRRAAFAAPAVFMLVFSLASAAAPNYPALLALRALVGIGLGGAPVAFALFLEFAPSATRGLALVGVQAFWTVGSIAEAALAWGVLGSLGWRWLIALSSIPCLILVAVIPCVPESPFYLAATGRTDAAEAVLRRVAASAGRSLPPGRLAVPASDKRPQSAPGPLPPYGAEGIPAAPRPPRRETWRDKVRVAAAGVGDLFTPALRRTSCLLLVVWMVNALVYYSLVLLTTTVQTGGDSKPRCGEHGTLHYTSKEMGAIFADACAELPGLLVAAVAIDLIGRRM